MAGDKARLPPRWLVVTAWHVHRRIVRASGGRKGLWWLNLQARPEAVVELAGGIRREVLGRAAVGGERERLWQRWRELDQNLDGYAARRPHETAVVVLKLRGGRTGGPLHAET
jgi:hypothetical protein